jgi:hypothetical protein
MSLSEYKAPILSHFPICPIKIIKPQKYGPNKAHFGPIEYNIGKALLFFGGVSSRLQVGVELHVGAKQGA